MKIGTIGTGFIVDYFITASKEVENAEVIACYSRNIDKAIEFANEHDITMDKAYDNLDAMLADPDIDTIYIASPNSLHYPQSLMAIQAGKNVICEKPFCSTLQEFEHVVSVAKENKLMIWEAITSIYTPNLNIIKDTLEEVGDVKMVTCNFSQFSSKYPAYKNGELPNVFNPSFSGGCIMDINIYNIHFVMYLFGKPNNYTYFANISEEGIDMSGTLIFEYDTFIATLIGAKDSASYGFACVQGDEGTITIEDSSLGVCKNAYLQKIKQDKEQIGIRQNNHMSYEIHAFEQMLTNKDFETCYALLEYSKDIVEIVENARKSVGVYYEADN